jgi:molecular chaperone GrpE
MGYEDLSRDELAEVTVELENELARMEERAMAIKADFENYKKQEQDRRDQWKQEAEKDLARDLIGVLDNLERAIMSADSDGSTLLKGVEMVADELFNTLQERGMERITAEEAEFNPRIHSAVDTQPHDEDNVVLETRRHGYRYQDDVLREAEVVVGKAQDSAGTAATGNETDTE